VVPTLQAYSPEFATQLADEWEALPPDCPRIELVPGCSALGTFTSDGMVLRQKIEAVE